MMPDWTVNQTNLDWLAEAVGIEKPVRVVIEKLKPDCYGQQGTFDDHHRIRLSNEIDAAQAQETLCHELWHCHQREQFDDPFDSTIAYQMADWQYGYSNNPFETEANDFAADVSKLVQLIDVADDLAVAA